MSGYGNVNIVSTNVGALSNDERVLFKVPTGYGGISILSAEIMSAGAGTSDVYLADLGTAGTSVAGTIATLGSAVYATGVAKSFTVSEAFVDEGHWVGVVENNVGALNTVTMVSLSYLNGK